MPRVADRTPYLSIAAASLFNSIGAFESAVAILAQWTQVPHTVDQLNQRSGNASQRALLVWLRLRAIFEIEALLDGKPEFLSNPGCREMIAIATKQMSGARHNHVVDNFYSDRNCRGNGDGSLYTQTEQYFHFNYVSLQQKCFQTLHRAESITEFDLREAERYASLDVSCFHHVASFEKNPKAWLGYFALISAELHARRGANAATRFGRASATADLDVARKRYRQAREMLQEGVDQANALDSKLQPHPTRAGADEPESGFRQLETKLLGGKRI